MKEKKGLTIISLAIMLVIMLAISSTVIVSTKYIMKETKKDKFVNEVGLITSATKSYNTRKSGNMDFAQVSWDLTEIYSNNSSQFADETITSNILTVYEIDLDKIDVENTYYGNKKDNRDRYLVSLDTGRIYYEKGYSYNGNTYYTVTEDIN